jgi:PAS domain-containing protein
VFQSLRNIAIQAAQNSTSTCMPLDGTASTPLVAQALHLELGHRLNGGLCVVSRHGVDAHAPGGGVPLERLAGLLSHRLNQLLEFDNERRKSQQFERWFRVSDRQIRALDLERQKFAALVSSFSGGAFLTNRDGVISWQSRPLFDRSGLADDSWVGHRCSEFCQALGGSGRLACGECLVSRVLISRAPVSCDIAIPDGTDEKSSRVVAAPINDLAGNAQEVIVTFQEAAPQARQAA